MAEVKDYCTLVTGEDERGVGLMMVGEASNRNCFEAIGGEVILMPELSDKYHSTYELRLGGAVVGSYTTWCGRQPCYHESVEDLVRVGNEARQRLAAKGLAVLRHGSGTYAVFETANLREVVQRFLKRKASFADLREAVEATTP